MRLLRSATLSSVPLLLLLQALLLPAVALAQHGHGHADHTVQSHETNTAPAVPATPSEVLLPSYWMHPEHVGLVYSHAALAILAWAVILPVAIMLSVGGSKLKVPAQFAFLVVNALCVFTSVAYNTATPDLYENNSHHKLGWAVTWIATVWCAMGLVSLYTGRSDAKPHHYEPLLRPVTRQTMKEYDHFNGQDDDMRWSGDSGQGTERNTNSLCHSSRSNSWNSDMANFAASQRQKPYFEPEDEEDGEVAPDGNRQIVPHSALDRFLSKQVARHATGASLKAFNFVYELLTRFQILLGYTAILTGLVTFGGIARGNHIFNVLAHLIKGGIFFWYGLLTLGRWMGCFADYGWAWNMKPGPEVVGKTKAMIPTGEFTESFVIWLYGVTNVFLEHLTAWGQAWSPTDLEHISITIMFAGGGMLGMLIESHTFRRLISTAVRAPANTNADEWKQPDSYRHPLNPMPGLIILLLGKMMSSHTQHSAVSGMIHGQWGSLFMMFAFARALTYITMWLKPPTGYLPTRPPTELISAFCLTSGGLIFMASNADSVAALEAYNLDAMFVFTVTMGLTATVMAWVLVTVGIKGWAVQRTQQPSTSPRAATDSAA